jgi:hypothetical protein
MLGAFLAGILEQLIALGRAVKEGGRRLDAFGLQLEAMPPFQDRFLGQFEFAGQLGARLTLKYAAQEQYDLSGQQVTALKECATVERVDALAHATTIHRQATAAIDAKVARLRAWCLTMWTGEAVRMEMLFEPRHTGVGIK